MFAKDKDSNLHNFSISFFRNLLRATLINGASVIHHSSSKKASLRICISPSQKILVAIFLPVPVQVTQETEALIKIKVNTKQGSSVSCSCSQHSIDCYFLLLPDFYSLFLLTIKCIELRERIEKENNKQIMTRVDEKGKERRIVSYLFKFV